MSGGFTIIEILVVVVIMGLLGTIVSATYPYMRAQQKLTLAEQTLQAALRTAQQAAINEERDPQCVLQVSAAGLPERLCSDIGVILEPTKSEFIIFADIDDDPANKWDEVKDFRLTTIAFPDGVQVKPSAPPVTLIFQGAPPTIKLFSGTTEIVSFQQVFLSIGNVERELHVGPYGQVERQ